MPSGQPPRGWPMAAPAQVGTGDEPGTVLAAREERCLFPVQRRPVGAAGAERGDRPCGGDPAGLPSRRGAPEAARHALSGGSARAGSARVAPPPYRPDHLAGIPRARTSSGARLGRAVAGPPGRSPSSHPSAGFGSSAASTHPAGATPWVQSPGATSVTVAMAPPRQAPERRQSSRVPNAPRRAKDEFPFPPHSPGRARQGRRGSRRVRLPLPLLPPQDPGVRTTLVHSS